MPLRKHLKKRGIELHVNYGGPDHRVKFEREVKYSDFEDGLLKFKNDTTYRDDKKKFTVAHSFVYRYVLFAYLLEPSYYELKIIPNRPKGISSFPEDNFQSIIITTHDPFFEIIQQSDKTIRAILMHEMGHSLGLRHGGPNTVEDNQNKPNHLSLMNNIYIDHGDGLTIIDEETGKEKDGLLDYSIFRFEDLNEKSLDERKGVTLKMGQDPLFPPYTRVDFYKIKFYRDKKWWEEIIPLCFENRCLVENYKIWEPVDWNQNGIIDWGLIEADISWSGEGRGEEAKEYYGKGKKVLVTDTEWDKLKFKAWNIGKAPSNIKVSSLADKVFNKKVLSCCMPPSVRYYSSFHYRLDYYKEGAFVINGIPGGQVALGLILMNIGKEADTYEIQVTTDNGWPASAEQSIHLLPGHKKVIQIIVSIPYSATISKEEQVHVKVKSQGNEFLSEGKNFYIRIVENLPQDLDGDNIPDNVETLLGLDPNNPDTDGDGIYDGIELIDLSNPEDYDGNGIIDALDPQNITLLDSDGDGLSDFREIMLGLNPNNPDTDGDGIIDSLEVGTPRENDPAIDFDGNGIPDALESSQQKKNVFPSDGTLGTEIYIWFWVWNKERKSDSWRFTIKNT